MEIKREFKGNVGLFLVCAELSKLNLIVMPTTRNTKGYDIVVLNPCTNKSVGLQVKCSDRKEFPIFSSHWKNYKEKIDEKILSPSLERKRKPDLWVLKLSDVEKYKDRWDSIISLLE